MANVFSPKPRHVVPSFRMFADTVALGELDPTTTDAPAQIPIDFESRVADWALEPSVGLAGDIISAALISGDRSVPQIAEAARFVLDHPGASSLAQRGAAQGILTNERPTKQQSTLLPRLGAFLEENNKQEIYRRIHELKAALVRFGDNPIALTELARLYLIVGSQSRAKKSVKMALSLAPYNRYVLRSAARLLARCDDAEQAFHLLQGNPRTQGDPWLASAGLAMAGLIGKERSVTKSAFRMLASSNLSPFSLAELRAGVGSVELMNGDRKRSRSLLKSSLEDPNDNTLAQVEWALSVDKLFDVDVSSFDVSRTFEALALEAYNQQQWVDVIRHCESWFMDMPFASRPVAMGSHVATVVLEDFQAAQVFCQAGLVASPYDPALINNYAYALALDDKPDEALRVLDSINVTTVEELRLKIVLGATRGLAYFRSGRMNEGRVLYKAAIDAAKGFQDLSLRQSAILNFAREEVLAGYRLHESVVDSIRGLKIEQRFVTTRILRDKVLNLIEGATSREADTTS